MAKQIHFKAFDDAGRLASAKLETFKETLIKNTPGRKRKPQLSKAERQAANFRRRIESLKGQLDRANELIKKLRKDARSMRNRLGEVTREEAASMNLEMMFPKQTPKKNVRRKKKARPSKLESLPGSDFKN